MNTTDLLGIARFTPIVAGLAKRMELSPKLMESYTMNEILLSSSIMNQN